MLEVGRSIDRAVGMDQESTSLGELMTRAAERFGERPAYVGPTESVTYGELSDIARRLATAFRKAGASSDRPVAYLGRQSVSFYLTIMASAYAGAPFVGLNWRLAAVELRAVLDDADVTAVVVEEEYLELARQAIGQNTVDTWPAGLSNLIRMARGELPTTQTVEADDVLTLVYTSGTTGTPKGVMLTHSNVLTSSRAYMRTPLLDSRPSLLLQAPTFHVSGSTFGLAPLFSGGTGYLCPSTDARDIVAAIVDNHITHLTVVPTALADMLSLPEAAGGSLDSLRCVVYGAAPISPDLLRLFVERASFGFAQSYGLTEAVGSLCILGPADHDLARPEILRSVGTPIECVELQIRDPETRGVLADGEVGEIWARGPSIMKGYWKDPVHTASAITPDGWLRTGDIGERRAGYYYIRDRLKDVIVSGGENIFSIEVENALVKHPAVVEAAVVGVPHPRWGETPVGVVLLSADASDVELIEHCRTLLAHYKCPTRIIREIQLPHNGVGKLQKAILRQQVVEALELEERRNV